MAAVLWKGRCRLFIFVFLMHKFNCQVSFVAEKPRLTERGFSISQF